MQSLLLENLSITVQNIYISSIIYVSTHQCMLLINIIKKIENRKISISIAVIFLVFITGSSACWCHHPLSSRAQCCVSCLLTIALLTVINVCSPGGIRLIENIST